MDSKPDYIPTGNGELEAVSLTVEENEILFDMILRKVLESIDSPPESIDNNCIEQGDYIWDILGN